jgi:predicted aspartyl protease
MKTADGRLVNARLVNIDSIKLGGFVLKNVSAIVCRACIPLLGQATLSQFDIKSARVQGVEFVTLLPRGP